MSTTQIKDGYSGGSDNQLKVNADGSINAAVSGSISGTVTANQGTSPWVVSGSVSATQSGTWNIGTLTTLTSITNPVAVTQSGIWDVSVNNFPSTFAVTQSTSPWVVSGSLGRTWVLDSSTDSIASVQSGTWNIGTVTTLTSITNPVTVNQGTSPWVVSGTITTSPDVNIHDSSGNALSATGSSLNANITNTIPVSQSGTWNIATVTTLTSITNPVAVTQSGIWSTGRTWTLASGTDSVAAVQSGTWNIGTLTTITNPVAVTQSGTWSTRTLDGAGNSISSTSNALNVSVQNASFSVTQGTSPWVVSGTVTANAGTNLNTSLLALDSTLTSKAQFTKLTDGTDTALITAAGELNVIATAQPGIDIGDVTVNNAAGAAAVNIQDGGNSITVDGTVAATQSGTWSVTSSFIPTGTAVNDYNVGTAVAAAATSNHDYAVTAAKTLYLNEIEASGSGKMKIEVQTETGSGTGVFNTKFVQFNSTAAPNMSIAIRNAISVVAGAKVRIIRTNLDGSAQNLYSSICGQES